MGRLRFDRWRFVIVAALFLFLPACGGHKPAGTNPFPAKITLNPTTSASMQLGSTLIFTASAVNGNNTSLNTTFTFSLTPTSQGGILEISPSGNACAGSWNAPFYSVCTPAGVGVVQVTASALGQTSPPTTVFVHPPVDNIQISVVPPVNSPPAACPNQVALPPACDLKFNSAGNSCLSQNQVMTLQAAAFSQGTDITPLVGPFTWLQANPNVVTITPIVTSSENVPTNQATVVSNIPGATQVVASASGVSSQPFIAETCPVQCIALEVSQNGSQNPTQTSFVTSKGTSETIAATAVDVQGCIVPKPPLTWTSSSPAALTAGSITATCAAGASCTIATTQAGGGAITASCTPPTCNIGFPLDAPGLSALYLPQPIYPVTAISGLVTGAATSANVLATSQDCYSNAQCPVALYNISSSKNAATSPIQMPTPPNSLMFDPAGDKAYAGSQYGADLITLSNLGSASTSPFTPLAAPGTTLGVVTGKVIAVSPNGNLAVFSDTVSTPNQVYIVNTTTGATGTTPLNINGATAAAFSPDNSKAFILGNGGNTLYIYSLLQALQTINLSTSANTIAFSSSGAFALLAGGGSASSLSLYNTCDNSLITNLTITPPPVPAPMFLKMVPAGNVPTGSTALIPTPYTNSGVQDVPLAIDFFYGVDSTGIDIIATSTSTSVATQPTTSLCSLQSTALAQYIPTGSSTPTPFQPLHINLQRGTFHPINVFVSPSAAQIYIVTTDQGVLVFNLNTQSLSAIPLLNNAAPVAADMSADGVLISVAGTDGLLHQINTQLGADQPSPISFPLLVNSTNNFCFMNYSCTLDVVAVKP